MQSYVTVILVLCTLLFSCKDAPTQSPGEENKTVEENIAAGLVMVADSMPITEDPLNKPYFTVKLISTEHTAHYGAYKVVADWAKNHAESEFAMPRGGEQLKPVLRKSNEPYTYVIGFHYEDEPEFYDYYQVSAARGEIKMKYLKAYSFK
ncbi:MAG: hypothetical protein EOO06_00545 [Chitinophagaceae bacterium]|nr:MAG: hypothetical protein EOO06_00545 [Chitinophagaceae bacterium]